MQAWWRKDIKLVLKKIYIKSTQTILFNLEILLFFGYSKAILFSKKIKKKYNDNFKYDEFFEYFKKGLSLLGKNKSKYKFSIWSCFGKFEFNSNNNKLANKDIIFRR